MPAWADLEPEEQESVNAYQRDMRAWQGALHKLLEQGENLKTYYSNNISSIMTALTNGSEIPKDGGLAGAVALTDTEIVNLESHIETAITQLNTQGHKDLRSKAAGINAGG